MIIGQIEGNEVLYNKSEDSILCKKLKVYAKDMIDAYESLCDRVVVPSTSKSELILRKFDERVRLGCFSLTIKECKTLIKSIKDARSKR